VLGRHFAFDVEGSRGVSVGILNWFYPNLACPWILWFEKSAGRFHKPPGSGGLSTLRSVFIRRMSGEIGAISSAGMGRNERHPPRTSRREARLSARTMACHQAPWRIDNPVLRLIIQAVNRIPGVWMGVYIRLGIGYVTSASRPVLGRPMTGEFSGTPPVAYGRCE